MQTAVLAVCYFIIAGEEGGVNRYLVFFGFFWILI